MCCPDTHQAGSSVRQKQTVFTRAFHFLVHLTTPLSHHRHRMVIVLYLCSNFCVVWFDAILWIPNTNTEVNHFLRSLTTRIYFINKSSWMKRIHTTRFVRSTLQGYSSPRVRRPQPLPLPCSMLSILCDVQYYLWHLLSILAIVVVAVPASLLTTLPVGPGILLSPIGFFQFIPRRPQEFVRSCPHAWMDIKDCWNSIISPPPNQKLVDIPSSICYYEIYSSIMYPAQQDL